MVGKANGNDDTVKNFHRDDSRKLITNDIVKGYYSNVKSTAQARKMKADGTSKAQSIPEFVDEMHAKYIEKMSVE